MESAAASALSKVNWYWVRLIVLSSVKSFEFALADAVQNAGYMQRGWVDLPIVVAD